jgi:uncharacterized protein YyaL (SSP411 family)
MTSSDHEVLLAKDKPGYDGAEPSGNSIHTLNLLRLGEFTSKESYNKRAVMAMKYFSKSLKLKPFSLSEMLLAVDFYYDKAKEIVIVLPDGKKDDGENLLKVFRKTFLPNRIVAVVSEGSDLKKLSAVIPLVEGKITFDGKATAFVCERGICKLPTNNPLVFEKQIKKTWVFK